jgi:diamine N-acetyltransferase
MMKNEVTLRALEKSDLSNIHRWNNSFKMMRYWFEEHYESYDELEDLYVKHIHDQSERRFILESGSNETVGMVELTEIDYIHRKCEFGILIDPSRQGMGYALPATVSSLNYAFNVLNLHKVSLVVDQRNEKAVYIYNKVGFVEQGILIDEFFIDGDYRSVLTMCMLGHQFSDKYNGRLKL